MVCHLYSLLFSFSSLFILFSFHSLLFSFSSLSYEEMSRQKKVTWDAILA